MAGDDTGFYALPDEGDQVLVAFEHGDFKALRAGRAVDGAAQAAGRQPGRQEQQAGAQNAIRTHHHLRRQAAGRTALTISAAGDLTIKATGQITLAAAGGSHRDHAGQRRSGCDMTRRRGDVASDVTTAPEVLTTGSTLTCGHGSRSRPAVPPGCRVPKAGPAGRTAAKTVHRMQRSRTTRTPSTLHCTKCRLGIGWRVVQADRRQHVRAARRLSRPVRRHPAADRAPLAARRRQSDQAARGGGGA